MLLHQHYSFPCMEQPTRCYVTSVSNDRRLSSSTEHGEVHLSEHRQRWEVWELYVSSNEHGNTGVCLKSVAHPGRILCTRSDPQQSDAHDVSTAKETELDSQHQILFLQSIPNSTSCEYQIITAGMDTMLVVDGPQDRPKIVPTPSSIEKSHWKLEFITGELCFLSNTISNKRIQCHPCGDVSTSENFLGWEVWRFIEIGDGNVILTSWTHDQKVLCSDANGKVYTTENKLGEWEKWRIEKKSNKGVLIKSVSHNRLLSCEEGGLTTISAETETIYWDLEPANRNSFYLSNITHNKRLGCKKEGALYATINRKSCEQWKIKFLENGSVTVMSNAHGHEKYLSVDNNGMLCMDDQEFSWDIEHSPNRGMYLRSNKRFLVCNSEGKIYVTLPNEECNDSLWSFEMNMPESLSGNEMLRRQKEESNSRWKMAFTIAGFTVMAPVLVTAAVASLGFGATGIVAGTYAAGMMSAEAVAAGGGVMAGGMVATLQSIGAAGLGFAGTTAAMGGGAVVGMAVSAAAVGGGGGGGGFNQGSTLPDGHRLEGVIDADTETINLPFAAWKSWTIQNLRFVTLYVCVLPG